MRSDGNALLWMSLPNDRGLLFDFFLTSPVSSVRDFTFVPAVKHSRRCAGFFVTKHQG